MKTRLRSVSRSRRRLNSFSSMTSFTQRATSAPSAFSSISSPSQEELCGPQGTLFGKNTTAGAINITTELPSFDWGLKGAVTYGNYNYLQLQGSVTGPITKDLAFRVTAYRAAECDDECAGGRLCVRPGRLRGL